MIVQLTILCLLSPVSPHEEDSCFADGSCREEENKYREETAGHAFDASHAHYMNLVHDAKIAEELYIKQSSGSTSACGQYQTIIDNDLLPFQSEISKSLIESALQRGGRSAVLYQIIDGRLYRSKECMFPSRCAGIEHFLSDIASTFPGNTEFVVNVRDDPQSHGTVTPLPIFSFSKDDNFHDILYPAWSFWAGGPSITSHPSGLGRWDQLRQTVSTAGNATAWSNKKPQAFFRGSRTSSERDELILLSRRQPSLVDAQYTKNQAWRSNKDTLGMPPAPEVSLEKHCEYRYLFNFRGVAASFRFKHLFLCRSLVLHVDSKWVEFFCSVLRPWYHYIPVNNDLTDVESILRFVKAEDQIAQQIAENGFRFIWNKLTLEDVTCYWRTLLQAYAQLLDYRISRREKLIIID